MLGPYRFIPVVILLGVAVALLTDRSKLPMALRGLNKILGRSSGSAVHDVPAWRRWLALALIIAAFILAVMHF